MGTKLTDLHQSGGFSARMLTDIDTKWQISEELGNLMIRCRFMGTARHQNRYATGLDAGSQEAVDDCRKNTRQTRMPSRIRNHDHRFTTALGEISERWSANREIDGPGQQSPKVA